MGLQAHATQETVPDNSFSVATLTDAALRATGTTLTTLGKHAGVSLSVARRWTDVGDEKVMNLRHVARLPVRLRQALLWPLLGEPDAAPSVAWCLGELGRIVAELAGCVGDETGRSTVDRLGAELMWLGARMRKGIVK
jgi:hypothetical protein